MCVAVEQKFSMPTVLLGDGTSTNFRPDFILCTEDFLYVVDVTVHLELGELLNISAEEKIMLNIVLY